MVSVLGKASKLHDDAVTMNFIEAGGAGCKACPLAGNGCYAEHVAKRRGNIAAGMEARRNKYGLVGLARLAYWELGGLIAAEQPPVWFRWSSLGAWPTPHMVTPEFWEAVDDVHQLCEDNDIPVHLPIQGLSKASWVRDNVRDSVIVRGSCLPIQTAHDIGTTPADTHEVFRRSQSPRSVVVGRKGMPYRERLQLCETVKEHAEKLGCTAMICPATEASMRTRLGEYAKTGEEKCGHCTTCSELTTDIVIYPFH